MFPIAIAVGGGHAKLGVHSLQQVNVKIMLGSVMRQRESRDLIQQARIVS